MPLFCTKRVHVIDISRQVEVELVLTTYIQFGDLVQWLPT